MDKQVEMVVEYKTEQVEFRALLDIEILAIGGGEAVVNTY